MDIETDNLIMNEKYQSKSLTHTLICNGEILLCGEGSKCKYFITKYL